MRLNRVAQRAARAVYGSIIALAVILVGGESDLSAVRVIGSTIAATIAANMAEFYASYIADVIRERRHPTREELRASAADAAAGTLAALAPVAPFVLVALGAIELDTAYDLAPWVGIGVIVAYTLLANRLAGLSPWRSAGVTTAAILIGLALIAIKTLAH